MMQSAVSSAQIVSGNCYMMGNYVQTSISGNGRLYTAATPPAGYQSSYDGGLGWVIDLDRDGWTVGNPPYFGDWFRCGAPVEEWYLQVGSTVCHPDASDSTITPGAIKGENYYFKASGSGIVGKWRATLGDLLLEQDYTLPADSFTIQTQVRIRNTGSVTLKDIYYMRVTEIDFPDPRYPFTGKELISHNRIKQQPPSGKGLAWVQETADTGSRGQMNMFTVDCRAKAFIIFDALLPFTSPDTIYQGIGGASHYYYTAGDYVYNDLGMGLVFKIDSLRAGESTSLYFVYNADSPGVVSGTSGTTFRPSWNIMGKSYKSRDTVGACPGTILTATIGLPGSSDWTWDADPTLAFRTGVSNNISVGKDTITYRAIRSGSGCVDADTLIVTIAPFIVDKPVIMRTGDRLTTTKAYKFYQWIRNGVDIPGATAFHYDITMKGCYSVRVTDANGCMSTSDTLCDGLSVEDFNMTGNPVVYPNPVSDKLMIRSSVQLNAAIADITGRILITREHASEIDMHLLNEGVYLLYLYTDDGKERRVFRILKEHQ
ncbi:hypothetical protein GCM10023092_17610 [Rurimicrobium arvi]|uniref:Secretion system C-terminal sorting domain-containing protein n=2 Tax=Rurimicrobium arvi TaxID=2049916 RepID=A0ABP8MTW4_9BACT